MQIDSKYLIVGLLALMVLFSGCTQKGANTTKQPATSGLGDREISPTSTQEDILVGEEVLISDDRVVSSLTLDDLNVTNYDSVDIDVIEEGSLIEAS